MFFEVLSPDLSQSYHNRVAHLPRTAPYASVVVQKNIIPPHCRTAMVPFSMFIPQTKPMSPEALGVKSIVTG